MTVTVGAPRTSLVSTPSDAEAVAGIAVAVAVAMESGVGGDGVARTGALNDLPVDAVLALLASLPGWSGLSGTKRNRWLRGAARVLEWLQTHPGAGWQERWLAAGADDPGWIDELTADDPRSQAWGRDELRSGLICLLLCRVVLPSHEFLARVSPAHLQSRARESMRPDLFAQMKQAAIDNGMAGPHVSQGLNTLTRIVLHTGRDLDQLRAEDIHEYRAWGQRTRGNPPPGTIAAWDLLRAIGVLPADVSLRVALREGQQSTAELVARYRIQCTPIRETLVRYLNERRPALDYSSFAGLVSQLVGRFWADIEAHHPGIDTLRLPEDVAEAWKQRIKVVTTKHKGSRPRRSRLEILMRVRSFYLDIQEWALEDPSWAPFAVPCPIRRSETEGIKKQKKRASAAMHQRIRERLPHLPALVDTAEQHRASQTALLNAARATMVGDEFEHDQTRYRRTVFKTHTRVPHRRRLEAVVVENLSTAEVIDLQRSENDAFWAWAVIETLRHTGVRIEELLEITHLALVSYRLPDTDELVPLLQIVPSKVNEERLLLVGPELASVLATIVTRLRGLNNCTNNGTNDDNADGINGASDRQVGGRIRLTCRYDQHERVTGPPLPHLFQRKVGYRHEMITPDGVQHLLSATLTRAGLTDATGQPLRYTPHDFRRMFATDAVTGGLPVHIAARLLGHHSLSATQAYLAVFQDDLVRSYRSYLDQRRATRPAAEYREPTDEEWREFQQHFQLRKLELGTCGRPYATPCQHEHACLRCPSLRVDTQQRPRLIAIIHNLRDRIAEARMNGWLGEVQGLQTSLDAAQRKLAALEKTRNTPPTDPVQLGMPTLADPHRA